jgi:hypothetical protein
LLNCFQWILIYSAEKPVKRFDPSRRVGFQQSRSKSIGSNLAMRMRMAEDEDNTKVGLPWAPTQDAPPNVLPVDTGSYQFMLETVPAVGNNTIPIQAFAAHLFENFTFLYAHEAQAYTSEMGLNEQHGQEALALRTYTTSIVPPIWRPDTEVVSNQSGPYFADTNHQWRRTPVLSTSANVLNVLDMSYRTGRGNPPFPIDRP